MPPGLPTVPKFDHLTFLLIDESSFARSLIKTALNTYGIRKVVEANDALSGLKKIKESSVDVLILENEMAPISGPELTVLIRQGQGIPNPKMPIIMVSGTADRIKFDEARQAGVHDYLVKPVSAEALYKRIQYTLTRPRNFVSNTTYIGPCRRRKSDPPPGGRERRKG